MMYQRNDDIPPIFTMPEEKAVKQYRVMPPRCALPLAEPLTGRPEPPLVPKPYRIMQDIRSISSLVHRNAAIDNNDALWVWGATEKVRISEADAQRNMTLYGSVGLISDNIPQKVEYVPKKIMGNVASVSVGHWHSLCVTRDRKLWSWGYNDYGELGTGNSADQYEPVFIMDGVKSAFAYHGKSFAITEDDSLWGWGNNKRLLFQGTPETIMCRKPVFLMNDVRTVTASEARVVVVKKNGELWYWGEPHINTEQIDFSPKLFMEGIKDVTIDTRDYSYGGLWLITAQNGDLYSFNYGHAIGGMCSLVMRKRLFGNAFHKAPVKVLANVERVCLGYDFSLTVLNNGQLYSSGMNYMGQCGKGKIPVDYGTNRPQLVMRNVVEAAAGHFHGMALQTNGDLWIWGGEYGLSAQQDSSLRSE